MIYSSKYVYSYHLDPLPGANKIFYIFRYFQKRCEIPNFCTAKLRSAM